MVAENTTCIPFSFLIGTCCLLPEPAGRGACRLVVKKIEALETPKSSRPAFTPAERRVLELIRAGLSNKEIATVLGRAEPTIKHQVSSLLRKSGLPSRTRLMAALG